MSTKDIIKEALDIDLNGNISDEEREELKYVLHSLEVKMNDEALAKKKDIIKTFLDKFEISNNLVITN